MHADLRKAAILLSSIPETDAARLWSAMDGDRFDQLAAATRDLQGVTAEERQRVAAELVDRQLDRDPSRRAQRTSAPWNPPTQRCLAELQEAPASWLAEQLAGELPQTSAVVICHLPPCQAAAVIANLSTEGQIQVIQRVASLDALDQDLIQQVVSSLSGKWRFSRISDICGQGGLATVAQIINRLDTATERALLENLAQQDRPLVDHLLKLMFALRECSPRRAIPGDSIAA